ncbi:hypothetical protein, partial [Alloprevotella sp. OH1205_COT-284]|uniref:hypothetical protein n=1 Tax=Alloprevotella sp. OH1205_COT-284 TaxID=2491043 RepID=UPI001F201FE7
PLPLLAPSPTMNLFLSTLSTLILQTAVSLTDTNVDKRFFRLQNLHVVYMPMFATNGEQR